jgi:transcriptional regulator with XRE-family HTH domain
MDAGRALLQARRRARLSQRDLARRAGVAQSTVARIERGLMDPRVSTLDSLLRACHDELRAVPRLGVGVDRTLIRAQLALSPAERILAVCNAARFADRVYQGRRSGAKIRMTFDPEAIVTALSAHEVRYVLIGGLAAVSQGSPVLTNDLDICYDRRRDNLERLAAALRDLNATLRGVDDEVPFLLDAETLRAGDSFAFSTDAGPFDVLGTPSGASGYDELAERAVAIDFDGQTVLAASIDDLIRMKEAAAREKDRLGLAHLHALRDELEGRPE